MFEDRRSGAAAATNSVEEQALYEQIGWLKMEVEWLTKKLPSSVSARRRWIEFDHPELSVRRQCELLELPRSTCYYQPVPESAALMRRIDEEYLRHPFYGSRRMAERTLTICVTLLPRERGTTPP